MAFPDLFKLEKLKIEAFSSRERTAATSLGAFEAMFNPSSISQRYAIRYSGRGGATGRHAARFAAVPPATLNLQLLLDGTGVDQIGLLTLFGANESVGDRIDKFMRLCYQINADSHEPSFLKVTWGKFNRQLSGDGFRGRLESVAINYTSFDRDGSPMRAQLDVAITSDDALDRQGSGLNLSSPDLTHSRLVRSGDTLPLMTSEVYGSPRHMVAVARANNLDQFRALDEGRELVFPPNRGLIMVAVPAITSGGTDLPASFDLVSVEVVNEVNRIPYAQIVLTDGEISKGEFPALDSDALAPGAEIEIKVREGDDITPLFKGQVARLRLEYSGGGPRLSVECKDKAFRLTTPRRSILYPDLSDPDAIAAVLRRAELDSGDLGSSTATSTLVQYDSTDWDFIVSRAEAAGSVVVVTDGSVALKPLAVSGTAAWTAKLGIDDIDDFELELDAGRQNPDVSAIGWDLPEAAVTDPASAEALELAQGNVDPAEAGQKLGIGDAVLRHLVPMSSDELKAWASARLAQSRLEMIRGRVSLGGAGDIEPMDLVELSGFGDRFNGNALISGLRHTIEDGEWRTDLRLGLSSEPFAEPEDIAAPPAQGLLPPARGLAVAKVADYEKDSDGEYRLRLALPGMGTSDDTIWARLAAPEAGNERGYFFRPDPGDEVVIAFLGEDPRHPVVLGALYGSKNKPPPAFADLSSDNVAKGLATKHGISLALADSDGKPVMTLKTPKGVVTIDDDKGEIRLSDGNSNSILLAKDGVVIKSGKDFKLEASGKLVLKGASIDAN